MRNIHENLSCQVAHSTTPLFIDRRYEGSERAHMSDERACAVRHAPRYEAHGLLLSCGVRTAISRKACARPASVWRWRRATCCKVQDSSQIGWLRCARGPHGNALSGVLQLQLRRANQAASPALKQKSVRSIAHPSHRCPLVTAKGPTGRRNTAPPRWRPTRNGVPHSSARAEPACCLCQCMFLVASLDPRSSVLHTVSRAA